MEPKERSTSYPASNEGSRAANLKLVQQHLTSGHYKQAETLAASIIQDHPLSAQAWVHLGEALLHQGYGLAARRVFERAWILDPQASWVDSVLASLGKVKNGPVRTFIDPLLAVKPVTVAAVIMTFNEERCIERCVRSLIVAVDEIIIMDTGSTDRTVELVQHLPKVKIINSEPVVDSFAAARNRGLSYVTSDWVLWVDADEWLFAEDAACVRELAGLFHSMAKPPVLSVCQVNYIQGTVVKDYSLPRFFPLHRGLQYYGRVHEQVVIAGTDLYDGGTFRQAVRIRLHHDGYEPTISQSKNKLNRNLALLKQMAAEEPNNPGWLLFYGRETLSSGDVDTALEIFKDAERAAKSTPLFGRLPDIYMFMFKIYLSRKDLELAKEVCILALQVNANFPDALYNLAQVEMRQAVALLQNAEEHLHSSKQAFQGYRGTVTADRSILDWKADLALADLANLSGKHADAKKRYEAISRKFPDLKAVKNKLSKLNERISPNHNLLNNQEETP